MTRRIRLTLEYDGRAYAGWQTQKQGERTIQVEVENALRPLLRETVRLRVAGRTDSGVHALGQVACFTTESEILLHRLRRGLDALLPDDIAVLKAEDVPLDFDPRKSLGKIYRYLILNRPARSPLLDGRVWHDRRRLDLEAMRRAAGHLIGEHDFTSFCSVDDSSRQRVRRLYDLSIHDPDDVGVLRMEFFATAFLKQMVRTLVGTLHQVGVKARDPDSIPEVLAAHDRSQAGPTAPPEGLYLFRVFYPDSPPPSLKLS